MNRNFKKCEEIAEANYGRFNQHDKFAALYGSVLRNLGKTLEAKEVLEVCIKGGSEDCHIANNYANILMDIGEVEGNQYSRDNLCQEPENAQAVK